MEKKKCLRCGYEWISRKQDGSDPVQCPKCKRVDWNKKGKKR